jgi:hypothetical protein
LSPKKQEEAITQIKRIIAVKNFGSEEEKIKTLIGSLQKITGRSSVYSTILRTIRRLSE